MLSIRVYTVDGLKETHGVYFPNLERLSITYYGYGQFYQDPKLFLSALDGSKLQALYYLGPEFNFKEVFFDRLKNLRELSLITLRDDCWLHLLPAIFLCTELRKLTVSDIKEEDVLPLVQGLSN